MIQFSETHEDDENSDINNIGHFYLDTNLNSQVGTKGLMTYFIFK